MSKKKNISASTDKSENRKKEKQFITSETERIISDILSGNAINLLKSAYDQYIEEKTEAFRVSLRTERVYDFMGRELSLENCDCFSAMLDLDIKDNDEYYDRFSSKIIEPYITKRTISEDLCFDRDSAYMTIHEEVLERLVNECSVRFQEDCVYGFISFYRIDDQEVESLLRENPNYVDLYKQIDKNERSVTEICDRIRTVMPKEYKDLFPSARALHRKFILHIGPTNSGKTHDAIEDLMRAENGVYLAPLRLLAFEIYDKLNSSGVPCSMVTGEEELRVEGSRHSSSTVEMLSLDTHYNVAVIDEAQMLSDKHRGGAWTNAILGVCADTVHICAAAHAEQILLRMISECGDEAEVIHHKRNTPLVHQSEPFRFPDDVRPGDALILFSKRAVLECASYVSDQGYRASVIYGTLPYEARMNEMKRFANGETDVVISTDAIGMGINMPVKRVVFLDDQKYDGSDKRGLHPQEVQQIAGRAGRKGMFEFGTYASVCNPGSMKKKYESAVPDIQKAVIQFPETLLDIDGKVSWLINGWMNSFRRDGYVLSDHTLESDLAEKLEQYTENKRLVYDFITIPFDCENRDLHSLWMGIFRAELLNNGVMFIQALINYEIPETGTINNDYGLRSAELCYQKYDLIFNVIRKLHPCEEALKKAAVEQKEAIARQIMDYLAKQKFSKKECKYCGKDLPWMYPYGMCDTCHRFRFPRHYDYDYYYDF